ncbi:MAG: helix-turn-helix transcriptional regulator [Candidatus Sumerlaeaceae bacterium]
MKKSAVRNSSEKFRDRHFLRLWTLIYLLSTATCSYSYHQMLKELEERGIPCCRRTLLRDLRVLQSAGWPLKCTTRRDGSKWWRLELKSGIPLPFPAEANEVLALAVARNALMLTDFAQLVRYLDQLWNRVGQIYPEGYRRLYDEVSANVVVQKASMREKMQDIGHYDQLMRAIEERRKVQITYRDHEGRLSKDRIIAPLKLFIASGHTYLRAFCYLRGEKRNFRLSRLQGQVVMLREQFSEELLRGIDKELDYALGGFHAKPELVVLAVDDMLASYLEENPLHVSQKIVRDKRFIKVELFVGLNETLFHKLLGFGEHIRVLEPAKLRLLLAERHKGAFESFCEPDGNGHQPELPLLVEE